MKTLTNLILFMAFSLSLSLVIMSIKAPESNPKSKELAEQLEDQGLKSQNKYPFIQQRAIESSDRFSKFL